MIRNRNKFTPVNLSHLPHLPWVQSDHVALILLHSKISIELVLRYVPARCNIHKLTLGHFARK